MTHTRFSEEKQVFRLPDVLADTPTHFCPGCHHGIVHRLLAGVLEGLGVVQDTICVASVGCSVFIYNYLLVDTVESPHGRAAAVATGVKRANPENVVFTYQGDGDLAAIGLSEIMYAANRGENMTVVFVNNTVYGMTGGQLAPTTMVGQKTTTSQHGRSFETDGAPLKMTEIMAGLPGVFFSARVAVNNVKNIKKAGKVLKKGFANQLQNKGFSFVEFLSACPTNWRMSPVEANERVGGEMIDYFPLGIFKDNDSDGTQF
ncbi:MAG: 2-oxoglutarate oxidoreductase [Desulfohalobiaceae bacterium]|nr:2-oxoglutarate oxidoreductase [Desulfohalobiaceae bacterium]